MTIEQTITHKPIKGSLAVAQPVFSPTQEYGVHTEWAVELSFQSPTGDSSDFIRREIPCLTQEQAISIADFWNAQVSPDTVGQFKLQEQKG